MREQTTTVNDGSVTDEWRTEFLKGVNERNFGTASYYTERNYKGYTIKGCTENGYDILKFGVKIDSDYTVAKAKETITTLICRKEVAEREALTTAA